MKKNMTYKIFKLSFSLLILLFFLCIGLYLSSSLNNLPNPLIYNAKDNLNVSTDVFPAIEKLLEEPIYPVSVLENKLIVFDPLKGYLQETALYKTFDNYAEYMNLEFVRGSYFKDTLIKENNNYIVIPESFAIKYYYTLDVIGETAIMHSEYNEDIVYTICGVYKEDDSFLANISKHRSNIVYTSLLSSYETKNDVNYLMVDTNKSVTGETMTDITTKITMQLNETKMQTFNYDTENLIMYHNMHFLSDFKRMSDTILRISLLLSAIIICILIIVFIVKTFSNMKKITIKSGLLIAFLLCLMAILLKLTMFTVDLPYLFLDEKRISSFKEMFDLVILYVRSRNSNIFYDYNFNYVYNIFTITIFNSLAIIVCAINFCSSIFKFVKFKKQAEL